MSHLLDRLQFFKKKQGEFADGHGETSNESRAWEGAYRQRWQHDKIVRSTHGVNCTGSCSWKIYVKNGLITWETQQTDYPRTRPDLPNHEPRGCPRGASYSWYIYSANRLKYPKVRKPLLKLWREARAQHGDPVNAWASIVEDAAKAKSYKSQRGLGGFVRSSWDEVTEIIAAANVYTAKTYGPDRVIGFSPIPAMSMVSYAAGARYLSLIGGVCLSFYDWYCDLPPASPQIWGEQTDVPESADWYNSSYIIAWGSNVPQTRTPDAHFFTEVRYKGTKTVSITPDYSEVAKLTDLWLNPKQGTDAALGMAFGHVILKEFHLDRPSAYFVDYCRQYTDMPMLVLLEEHAGGAFKPTRYLRAADLADNLGQDNNPEWKTIAYDERSGGLVSPTGAIGYRWGESGKWNIAELDGRSGDQTRLQLSLLDGPEHACEVAFPYFAGQEHPHFKGVANDEVLLRRVPFREIVAADGKRLRVATVYDLQMANYSIDRGLGGDNVATSYEDADTPYTPAWQERITGVPAARATQVAREFADSADKTRGKAMVIIGAAMNHWYHMDMNYRAVINMLMMCGCIGQSGGGWAHYVGQEKLRPQTGWAPLAFGLDWSRPPRQMNGTSFFYLHSSQWRHEKLSMHEVLSPLADASRFAEHALDYNIQAERLGWLPSAPQLNRNPLRIAAEAEAAGLPVADYVVRELKSGGLRFASESPDDPQNFPRNMFIWRSNLLGSSGKGHEYMLKYLLGAKNGVMNDDLGKAGGPRPTEVDWVDDGAEGKLDLVTTLDFRMSSTCMYSDIVLPTATWYEKDDLNTSDMHPFIHPLSAATDPAWEAKSDWEIYKAIAKKFSAVAEGHLGVEQDLVTVPLLHDTPTELAQPFGGDGHDWKKGECEPMPGRNLPTLHLVERDYPNVYRKFTSLGPLLDKLGNGGKGIGWNTEKEVKLVGDLNHRVVESGVSQGRPRIDSAIDAAIAVLRQVRPEVGGLDGIAHPVVEQREVQRGVLAEGAAVAQFDQARALRVEVGVDQHGLADGGAEGGVAVLEGGEAATVSQVQLDFAGFVERMHQAPLPVERLGVVVRVFLLAGPALAVGLVLPCLQAFPPVVADPEDHPRGRVEGPLVFAGERPGAVFEAPPGPAVLAFAVDVLLPVQGEGQAVVLAQALAEFHPGAVGPVVVLAATALAGFQVGATVVLLQGVLEGVAVQARTQARAFAELGAGVEVQAFLVPVRPAPVAALERRIAAGVGWRLLVAVLLEVGQHVFVAGIGRQAQLQGAAGVAAGRVGAFAVATQVVAVAQAAGEGAGVAVEPGAAGLEEALAALAAEGEIRRPADPPCVARPALAEAEAGLEGAGRATGRQVDRPAEHVRPLQQRGVALGHFDAGQVRGEEAAEVDVAVVGHVDRHAVDEQRHLARVEAAYADLAFVAVAAALQVDAGEGVQRLADVAAVEALEVFAGDAVRRAEGIAPGADFHVGKRDRRLRLGSGSAHQGQCQAGDQPVGKKVLHGSGDLVMYFFT